MPSGSVSPESPAVIAAFLESLGVPVDDVAADFTEKRLVALAAGGTGALAAIPTGRVLDMLAVFGENLTVRQDFTGMYTGELLFFEASHRDEASPSQWRDYVTGAIEVVPVGCEHGEMVTPEALATIGPVVARRLGR